MVLGIELENFARYVTNEADAVGRSSLPHTRLPYDDDGLMVARSIQKFSRFPFIRGAVQAVRGTSPETSVKERIFGVKIIGW